MTKEESIIREIYFFIELNKEICKQLSMETLSPAEVLQFAVFRGKVEMN